MRRQVVGTRGRAPLSPRRRAAIVGVGALTLTGGAVALPPATFAEPAPSRVAGPADSMVATPAGSLAAGPLARIQLGQTRLDVPDPGLTALGVEVPSASLTAHGSGVPVGVATAPESATTPAADDERGPVPVGEPGSPVTARGPGLDQSAAPAGEAEVNAARADSLAAPAPDVERERLRARATLAREKSLPVADLGLGVRAPLVEEPAGGEDAVTVDLAVDQSAPPAASGDWDLMPEVAFAAIPLLIAMGLAVAHGRRSAPGAAARGRHASR